MGTYIIRRLLGVIPVVIVILTFVFFLLHLAPGNPVSLLLAEDAVQEDIDRMMALYGFDRPLHIQYFDFILNALRLDFGESLVYAESVTALILERLPATLELAFAAIFVGIFIGIPLGILASLRPNSLIDRIATTTGLLGVSIPNFWLGIMLIIILAGSFGWFPTGGRAAYGAITATGPTGMFTIDTLLHGNFSEFKIALSHLILPAVTLGTAMAGMLMRITRSSMLEVMNQDFIRTARAKGITEKMVVYSHTFRNALIPVVTVIGIQLGTLIGGSVITETIFGWPGMGLLLIDSIGMRDYFLVQGIVFFIALVFIFLNLLVDISYRFIDPRIRY